MHTISWLIWLGAALVVVGLTTNPLYLALAMLAATLVFVVWREPTQLARAYRLFLLLGLALWLGYLLFSVVTVGAARGPTVLFTLPMLQLPALLGGLTLGGPVAAEDLVWGAIRGLRVWAFLISFGTFNALIDHYQLLRLTPRSLFHAGLAVTIAITFVPQLVRTIAEISEAQRVRGHRFRGLASYVPLVAPLLAGSLEGSIQLAEALDARGYGRTSDTTRLPQAQPRVALLGLLLLGAGLFAWLYYGASLVAAAILLVGGAALVLALRALGRRVTRTTYRHERWRRRDTLASVFVLVGAFAWAGLRLADSGGLIYNPYPLIAPPLFSAPAAILLLLLATPALLRPRHLEARTARPHSARDTRTQMLAGVASEADPVTLVT